MHLSSDKYQNITCASDAVMRQRIADDYAERVRSLRNDGYALRHDSRLPTVWLARLHHMSNGNDIIVCADYRVFILKQMTNKVLVHSCQYRVDDKMCQP